MVQTNKILTVSYGTFSCTLEGFDESFETMKAIAEYFRDLAADDRYFGAEPPTPDADMLARIAEREISRRVEAHTGDEGIVLRPSLADATTNAAAPAPASEPAAEPEPEPEIEDLSALVSDATPEDAETQDPEDALENAALALSEEFVADEAESDEAVTELDIATEDSGSDESIADKLRRIRDVVGTQDLSEDHQDAPNADADEDVRDEASLMDNVMATLGSESSVDELTADDEDDLVEAQSYDAPETADVAEDEDHADDVTPADDDEQEEGSAEAEAAPVAPARVAPRRPVRVVKVKRRAVDAAINAGQLVEDTSDTEDTGNSSLSAEDEADLQRELAQLEEEIGGGTDPVAEELPAEDAEEAARAVRSLARRDRLESIGDETSDVTRLMAQTDEQLNEPEGRSRRNAIAHLRAAVAATRADRTGGAEAADDPRDAYRDDLAQAVRPRRSQPEGNAPRVAPLKLVAEQRVDVTEEKPAEDPRTSAAQAVRPRRVAMVHDDDVEETPGGFAAFAEERGAHRLPDLLEAAAAYMSFVEGRERFSRPQLMNKVRQVEGVDTSREDRLRSFGQLLREGKIEKVDGGRFTASDSIGFKPDARAAS